MAQDRRATILGIIERLKFATFYHKNRHLSPNKSKLRTLESNMLSTGRKRKKREKLQTSIQQTLNIAKPEKGLCTHLTHDIDFSSS